VATADLPTYNAHILKTNNTWTTNPATSASFLRGYNNYDISYTAVKYSVTFDSAGGSAVPNDVVYQGDEAIQPTDPIRDGYKFLGWFTRDPVSGDLAPWDFSTVLTGDLDLIAMWEGPGAPNTGLPKVNPDTTLPALAVIVAGALILAGSVIGIVLAGRKRLNA
jgi:uncharacterized repeat protein (TIGR02543 family)